MYEAVTGWANGLLTQNQALEALNYPSIGPEGDRYVWEITGTPPEMPKPKPPMRPTRLGYDPSTPAAPLLVPEVHCPVDGCGRWIGRNLNIGGEAYCPVHKGVPVAAA